MKSVYLVGAVLGAVLPYVFFIQHFSAEGLALGGFVSAVLATPAATGFTADLLVSSAVFWIFLFRESALHGVRHAWAFVAVNLLIGLSCALPLFLYVRERQMAA